MALTHVSDAKFVWVLVDVLENDFANTGVYSSPERAVEYINEWTNTAPKEDAPEWVDLPIEIVERGDVHWQVRVGPQVFLIIRTFYRD